MTDAKIPSDIQWLVVEDGGRRRRKKKQLFYAFPVIGILAHLHILRR